MMNLDSLLAITTPTPIDKLDSVPEHDDLHRAFSADVLLGVAEDMQASETGDAIMEQRFGRYAPVSHQRLYNRVRVVLVQRQTPQNFIFIAGFSYRGGPFRPSSHALVVATQSIEPWDEVMPDFSKHAFDTLVPSPA